MNRLRALSALLGLATLVACEKNAIEELAGPEPGARIKFFNFSVGAPAVNFYAGDQKITAVAPLAGGESTNGTGFGGVGLAAFYAGIEPGTYTFTGRITATVDKDLPITTLAGATLADGGSYSFYMSGFYDAVGKTTANFLVADDYPPEIDFTTAYVRFVNAIGNSAPMTLYATNSVGGAVVQVGGEIAYQSAGAFVAVPAGTYNLGTRVAGGVTDLIARTGVTFDARRVYTVGAIGDITVGGTTLATRRRLDNTINR